MKSVNPNQKTVHTLLLLGVSFTLSACSMTKNLDEMHANTKEMNGTTAQMNEKTGRMAKTTDEMLEVTQNMSGTTNQMLGVTQGMSDTTRQMSDTTQRMSRTTDRLSDLTGEMYNALRQGDSMTARRLGLKAIGEAADGAPKISEAGKYLMSFEYQLWSGLGQDDKRVRDSLAADAAKEFMRDIHTFMAHGQTEAKPFANALKDGKEEANREQSLNAIAVALHLPNPKQERNAQIAENQRMTMYSMLQNALRAAKEINAGRKRVSDYPEYVHQILIYETEARLLMQVRYNYFGAMVLARATNIRDGVTSFLGMRLRNWELNLSKFGIVEINGFGEYLRGAVRTYNFMTTEAGITPVMESNLKAVFGNMKLSNQLKAAAAMDPAKASLRVAEEAAFIKQLVEYRKSAGITDAL